MLFAATPQLGIILCQNLFLIHVVEYKLISIDWPNKYEYLLAVLLNPLYNIAKSWIASCPIWDIISIIILKISLGSFNGVLHDLLDKQKVLLSASPDQAYEFQIALLPLIIFRQAVQYLV